MLPPFSSMTWVLNVAVDTKALGFLVIASSAFLLSCVATDWETVDADGDGYRHEQDCDDTDAATFPGAAEEDSLTACMTDADGDGWGDDSPVVGVETGTDCDDSDASMTPADADMDGLSTCAGDCDDSDAFMNQDDFDADGDSTCDGDCDDEDATLNLDDVDGDDANICDGDCDDGDPGLNLDDADADGFSTCDGDCDDGDPDTYPGAAVNDSASDCMTDVDGDGWGDDSPNVGANGGTDCDDRDPCTYPGAAPSESVTACMTDVDGDGWGDDSPAANTTPGADCDDTDPTIHPGMEESWYDGVDSDCDGWSDFDADGDGADSDLYGGTDCDDSDPTIGIDETWYDGIDSDCDGWNDYDSDYDGYESADYGGTDCDDTDPDIHPDATDTCADGIDSNCNGDDGYWVPDDAPTIQDAINTVSGAGESICVHSGTYYENIDFVGNSIRVTGVDGAEQTTINGSCAGVVLAFTSGETDEAIVEGFTITNGCSTSGAGIYIEDSSPTLRHLRVEGNSATDSVTAYADGDYETRAQGAGLYVAGTSTPSLTNSIVYNNYTYAYLKVYLNVADRHT